MKLFAKVAVMLGIWPVSIVLMLIVAIAIAAGFYLQSESISSSQIEQKQQFHSAAAKIIASAVTDKVEEMQQQAAAVAATPEVIDAMASNDTQKIAALQQQLTSIFPSALRTCLVSSNVNETDPSNACIPITFATLNSIRTAKEEGSAPIALLQMKSEDAHLLFAQRIQLSDAETLGVLLIAMPSSFVESMFNQSFDAGGYVELQQGIKKKTAVNRVGNAALKTDSPVTSIKIPGSYWRVVYWADTSVQTAFPITLAGGLLFILSVLWLLREFWFGFLVRLDAITIEQQLQDFKKQKLRPKYPIINKVLMHVVDDIQTLGREGVAVAEKNKKPQKSAVSSVAAVSASQQPIDLSPDIFSGYDIRGRVGETLNEEIITSLGQAIASEAMGQGISTLLVGRDARLSSDSFASALKSGILSTGCNVLDIGQVPIPVLYFACATSSNSSGVMVTGSHNPDEYNGLKVVFDNKPVTADVLQKFYQRIQEDDFEFGEGSENTADLIDDYISRITHDVSVDRPLKVVVDCANAVSALVAPKLLRAIGCEVEELYCKVDGTYPNHQPNPSDPSNFTGLIQAVQQSQAELGITFDGDGDRIGVVDGTGKIIWPDQLMVLFAQDVLSRNPEANIIYDVKSTSLLADVISRTGGKPVMSPSGYPIIRNKLYEIHAALAGEMSGHIFFQDRWFGFDDGLYSATRLLELLSMDPLERAPTEVFSSMPQLVSTPEIIIEMNAGEAQRFVEQLQHDAKFDGANISTIDGVRVDYPDGWGLIRASHTSAALSLRFEAANDGVMEHIKQQFKQQMLQIKPTLTLSF
jgi:phosphomannomutase/phosphoglucomutase